MKLSDLINEHNSRDCPDCEGGYYTDPKNVDEYGNCNTCGGSGEVEDTFRPSEKY